jgi:hypothetical protein
MGKPTVLFFSEVNWDYLKQRHHFFAESYKQKGHEVIYIGKIGLRYPKAKEILDLLKFKKGKKEYNIIKTNDITLYDGFFLPPINFFFNVLNKIIFLKRFTKSLSGNKVIIHFYQPTDLIIALIKRLKNFNYEITLIYDCVQDYRFHPSRVKGLLKNEKDLAVRCKVNLADSIVNFDRLPPTNKILIPPGVDTDHFKIRAHGVTSTPIRKILYFGNIRQDLDIELINQIGSSKNFELTLIGLLNIERKYIHSSVEILNSVYYHELPDIIQNYDALILPYDIKNPFTKAIIPAKFFECICTGLAVLSTKMESTKEYHKYLTIVSSETDFDNLQINSLNKEAVQSIKALIDLSSWENRFENFYREIK